MSDETKTVTFPETDPIQINANERVPGSTILPQSITWEKIQGGTLILGGTNNVSGLFSLKDASGVEKIAMDNTGMTINGGKITIKDSTDTTIIDATGLVSTANFASGDVTDTLEWTTTSETWVNVTNMTLSFTTARSAKVLFGTSVIGCNASSAAANIYNAGVRMYLDGAMTGTMILLPGILRNAGVMVMSGSVTSIETVAAGNHTLTMQSRIYNGGSVYLAPTNEKVLWYVVLGN